MVSHARAGSSIRGASAVLDAEETAGIFKMAKDALLGLQVRHLKILAILAVFIAVMVSPKAWLLSAIDHNIDRLALHGELNNVHAKDIEKVLHNVIGGSFILTDLTEIKTDVESLPWVKDVTVRREWPGTISLTLIEQTPVAFWNEGAFVNGVGEVFTPESIVRSDWALPALTGPVESDVVTRVDMLADMEHVRTLLSPHGLVATSLAMDERGSWMLTLDDGLEVILGSKPFESKVERLVALLASKSDLSRAQMEKIDTRYANGVAVRWKDVTVADSAGP